VIDTGARLQQVGDGRALLDRCQRTLVVDAEVGERLRELDPPFVHVDAVQRAQVALADGVDVRTSFSLSADQPSCSADGARVHVLSG